MVKKLLLFVALLHVFSGCGAPVRRPVSQPGPAASVVKPLPPREVPALTPAPGVPKPSVRLTPGPKTVSPLVRIPDDQLPWFADDMDNPTKRAKAVSDVREVLTWKKYLIPAALIGWLIDTEVAAIRKMQSSCGAETNLHDDETG